MGLTRESWCCAGGRLSRLDMNTQTSIKPVCYYKIVVAHILSLQGRHESTTVVHIELTKRAFKCHVEGCTTALFLFCFCFLFGIPAWRLM